MPFIVPSYPDTQEPIVATTGLKILGATRGSVIDANANLVEGMEVFFAARLYDADTHEFISFASTVAVNVELPGNGGDITLVTMEEDDEGLYSGGYIPEVAGEWSCELVYGAVPVVLDQKKFYVAQRKVV